MVDRLETASCFCGRVQAECEGEPFWINYDHDADCRQAIGGPLTVWVGYRPQQFRITKGEMKRFSKTSGVTRTFCGNCGSSIGYFDEGIKDEIYLTIGFFDNPEGFKPAAHGYWREKLSWVEFSDNLPRFDEYTRIRDAEFGNPNTRKTSGERSKGRETVNMSTGQQEIIRSLGVSQDFDPVSQTQDRIGFLAEYLRSSGSMTYVLGISGGVDSLLAGMLAQSAVEQLRENGYDAQFIAVRLPYGVQADEDAASMALTAISPDRVLTINIKPAVDAMMMALKRGDLAFRDEAHEDFVLGNIKARERMIAQYAIAGAHHGLVIGTDHAAEAVMGFFTKHGDGAADILPLSGLIKRRIRAMAATLGAPDHLVTKVPTADLESLVPQRPDEDAYGVTYDQIDDFLEGKLIVENARDIIVRAYKATQHKRALPVSTVS